jgi:hypothetical protein
MQNRTTPDEIFYSPNTGVNLNSDQVFVFGSNLRGIHGAGAAKFAFSQLGYPWGLPMGLNDNHSAYGIPTKDKNIETLPLEQIEYYIIIFIDFAKKHYNLQFLVTEIGCGLAGYQPKDIAPLFKDAVNIQNIHLPKRFWKILDGKMA